jgi:hypothetical protein
MPSRTYADVNLPVFPGGDWIFSGLQYCSAARTLLVTLRCRSGANAVRVYVRAADEDAYREISSTAPVEYWSACVSSAAPLAFVSAWESNSHGLALYRGELPNPEFQRLPSLHLEGDHARAWVTSLHSASSDGTELLVSVAVQPQAAADGSYNVRFVLAHMAVTNGAITIVAELPAVFA